MERPSFLSPTAPGARKNVRARLAARKENVSPPSPDEVAAALKARQDLAAANRRKHAERSADALRARSARGRVPGGDPPGESQGTRTTMSQVSTATYL